MDKRLSQKYLSTNFTNNHELFYYDNQHNKKSEIFYLGMKNKKHIMVCVSRFLASLEMTAKFKDREKRLAAAKPPLNAPFSHMQRVMSTEGRHLLKPLQVNNFPFLSVNSCNSWTFKAASYSTTTISAPPVFPAMKVSAHQYGLGYRFSRQA